MIDGIRNATLGLSMNSTAADQSLLARLSRSLIRPVDGAALGLDGVHFTREDLR